MDALEMHPAALVPVEKLSEARRLLAAGASLSEAASIIEEKARDLDLSLWRAMGNGQ